MVGEVKKHEWTDAMLEELIKWERNCVEPKPEELHTSRWKIKTSRGQNGMHSALSDILPNETG